MKKWLIGSLVGAILLFVWQFISWGAANLHDEEMKHHPQQEQLINALSGIIKEDGQYMVPRAAPGASREEMEKSMQAMSGKPWAMITYHSSFEVNMVMPMIRSFCVDLLIVLLLIMVLGKRSDLSMGSTYMATLAVGLIAWLWHPYTMNIWFQTPRVVLTGALLDWIVAYSLVGLWLGYWLKKVS